MKKLCTFIAIICIALFSVSCTSEKTAIKGDSGSATPKTSNSTDLVVQSAQASDKQDTALIGQNPAEVKQEDGLSLESIKKAAQGSGYVVEEVQDRQIHIVPKPIGGINVIYEDENSSAHIPVLEFTNAEDAQACAKEINESGYNLCIINGRFLTMTSAKYGVVLNDKENAMLENLLKSKVMEYIEPAPAAIFPAKDYAGAYKQIEAIRTALDKLINKSVLLYCKTIPQDEAEKTAGLNFSPISSGDLAFTGTLCEDQTQIDAVRQVWEMFGCTDFILKHDAEHDYILIGKRAGVEAKFEIHCVYSPDTGALRLVEKDNAEVKEFYEYVPLGADKYAFQTLFERALVEYKDGKIISAVYSRNKRDKSSDFNPDKDGIYPKGAGLDSGWVSKAGADSYEQFIAYDGAKLDIGADNFMGERVKMEINAP